MYHLFSHLDKIKKLVRGKLIFIFLDYDGTLTPIVKSPDAAKLSGQTKKLLRKLSKNKICKVAIISGRQLTDIKSKVGLNGIIYSGNHGFEVSGPKIKFKVAIPGEYNRVLKKIKNQLKSKLSSIKGIFLEDKRFCVAFHYRLVDKNKIPLVESLFRKVTRPYLLKKRIKIKAGKMVFDIEPAVARDKGRVVLELIGRQKALSDRKGIFPVYIGDDTTDEDAFRVLKNNGLAVFVGKPKRSHAGYYLKNTKEVFKLLKTIQAFRG